MSEFPRKPEFGAPCNGCGMCCVATACPNAIRYVDGAALGQPCPALEWEHGRSWCGLVRDPERHSLVLAVVVLAGHATRTELSEGLARANATGRGCDAGPPPEEAAFKVDEDVGLTAAEFLNLCALGLR